MNSKNLEVLTFSPFFIKIEPFEKKFKLKTKPDKKIKTLFPIERAAITKHIESKSNTFDETSYLLFNDLDEIQKTTVKEKSYFLKMFTAVSKNFLLFRISVTTK